MTDKSDYVVVSFSGGKDSTAMLLRMMEIGEHIDEVINTDTGMEFPGMYRHIDKVRSEVEKNGIRYTRLTHTESFEYMMLDYTVHSKKYGEYHGKGWPTPVIRWCTRYFKTDLIKHHLKPLSEKYNLIQCVGLAQDEERRREREQ